MNTRQTVLKEIRAFASEYAHNVEGRDVVIVDQLLNFLSDNNDAVTLHCFHCGKNVTMWKENIRTPFYCGECK
jgi:hypothetical protein